MNELKNNAYGTIAGAITNVATAINLTAGHGARFPAIAAGGYFYADLVDSSNQLEIVKVTARAADALTVIRAQDGSAARAYAAGSRLELRLPVASLRALQQEAVSAVTAAGTDIYTATLSPVPTGYNTDQIYFVKIANVNTGGSTLNLNGLGAKTIKTAAGAALVGGELVAGTVAMFHYDGVDMRHVNGGGGGSGETAGVIKLWGGAAIPSGYLECNGQAVSRVTYAALWAAYGTTHGVGDGSTTFNVPDMRDRVPIGVSPGALDANRPSARALGATAGAETHTLTEAETPAHTHTYNEYSGALLGGGAPTSGSGSQGQLTATASGSTGGDGAHNNVQPSIALYWVVKT